MEPDERKRLSFAQAEGAAELPRQLALREVPQSLRAQMWAIIYQFMSAAFDYYSGTHKNWVNLLTRWHVMEKSRFLDDFEKDVMSHVDELKLIIAGGNYVEFFGLIEFIAKDPSKPGGIVRAMNTVLEKCHAAYRLIDDVVVPVASDADVQTVTTAFAKLGNGRFPGAHTHLAAAAEALTMGRFADSVRESIHAVESVVLTLVPKANAFSPALGALEKTGALHGSLKAGFGSLYGYTSDEQGIRHALLEKGDAAVSEADALYMFGVCSAFATYVVTKLESGT